jgi:hypothetical protein
MKHVARILSFAALAGTLAPALLFFTDALNSTQTNAWMAAAMVLWFATAPFWMEHKTTD